MGDLVEVPVSELSGAALDWAVASVEGVSVALCPPAYGNGWRVRYELIHCQAKYSPSAEWHQAGPVIEHNHVAFRSRSGGWAAGVEVSEAQIEWHHGSDPLVAICRAVVAHKQGPFIRIPQELM